MRNNVIRLAAPMPSYVVTIEVGKTRVITEKRAKNASAAIADAIVGLGSGYPLRVTAKRKW